MKNTYTILDEYIDLCNKYQTTYGNQTVVLMQVGGFFEIYAVKNDSESLGADIYTISDLLNIQVSRKTKNIIEVSRNNHLLAGFPNHSMKKFLDILVNHNYTVVVVEQVTSSPNPKRSVTNIISSSTYLEQTRPLDSSGMMIIHIDVTECWKTKRKYTVIGWSYMDVLTGNIRCNEITSIEDTKLLIDELQRIVLVENPREVVITSMEGSTVTCGGNMSSDSLRTQLRRLFTTLDICFHDKLNCLNVSFQEKKYQNEMLRKVYPQHGLLSPIEFVNLEARPLALISMVYLIQFAYEHNEHIVMNIPKPQILDESSNSRLILASNCINQLDITHQNTFEGGCKDNIHSLLRILNRCQTAVGRRYFKSRLLTPTQDIIDITANYDRTEAFIKSGIWSTLEKSLSGVLDIERLYRRLQMRKIQPCEFVSLFQSILAVHESIDLVVQELYGEGEVCDNFPTLKSAKNGDQIGSFRTSCESTLNMEQSLKCNFDTIKSNIFQNGINHEIDSICEQIGHIMTTLEEPVSHVSKGEWAGWVKLEHNETDGFFYTMTGKRFETLKSSPGFKSLFSKSTELLMEGIQKGGKHTTQGVKIQSKEMKTLSNEINQLQESLKTTTTKAFHQFMDELQVGFDTFIKSTVRALETLDFHAICAKNAVRLCHVRPDIDTKEDASFIDIEDLRHPIIEHIQTHLEYVPNTVKLGSSNDSSAGPNGMVLYGVNAAGKSSLMKSVGIALIMAQAGMYVSAGKMTYHPYAYLFTRIQSRDDIYRGMSTFSMEISELRNILKRANFKSLIIGDELCSGTETISGVSIVCAGIKTLVDAESTFLFATHLHQLTSLKVMTDLEREHKICIQHLSVTYDENNQALVYDRKLKDGPGQELYGLEVCKALDLDPGFLHLAGQIRHNLLHGTSTMVTNAKSSYNRDVIMNECKVCGASSNIRKLEAHHIQYQSTSDARGFIENRFHKNKEFNLVSICDKCHDAVHSGELKIHGWVQSTKGVHLRYDWNEDKRYLNHMGHATVNDTMQKHRHDIVEIRKNNSLKKTNEILKSRYDVVVSEYKLNKWLKEII